MPEPRTGRCNCGAVRFVTRGAPVRVGLCHCLTCQRDAGGPFIAFGVWRSEDVTITGEVREWGDTAYRRGFCGECGSRVGLLPEEGGVEVRLGALDDGGRGLVPEYELWTIRRQPWLAPVPGARQYDKDRT